MSAVTDPLAARFAAAGHALYLVGGPVRDALLGRETNDLDFTTDARPETILELISPLGATWTMGMEFGTVGVQVDGHRCEITTFRSDSYDATSRKPEVAFGDTIEGDLGRRDFTVNAMAVALPVDAAKPIVDPYGGLDDLIAKQLRTPITAEQSFDDDPLRMLRAARFAAQLGFDVVPEVVEAIRSMASRIEIVSAERIRDELTKLICSPDPRRGLELLVETGLIAYCLPEVGRLTETVDEHRRHKDVYAHTLTVLEQAMALEPDGPDLVLRMAALLHDIGKPKTKSIEPGGKVSFHHHEVVGASMTKQRMAALRYPKDVIDDVARLVELHLRFHGYSGGTWTDAAVRRYVRDAGPLLGRLHLLTRSDCTTRNARKARALAAAYDSLEQRIEELAAQEDLDRIRPDLDGNEIMAELGLAPGPLVGKAYQHLLALRMERGPMSREEALAALHEWAADQDIVTID
ncbi:MAG: CCA tRNA nucleotidyltransferase [Frankiaceae bacterium]|nr:CCA tRNA nucleotidyltransferase [Frankiaceae bacterium]MBV9870997.1 CCA tRNA nucleotidyltransferase [Frankiaceae bacterium]